MASEAAGEGEKSAAEVIEDGYFLIMLGFVDVFQPKISRSLSFSGMQQKLFIDRRNRKILR